MNEPSCQKPLMKILDEIVSFMGRHASPNGSWYVGTAKDARAQLFNVHGFKQGDVGLYRTAGTNTDAAELARHLIDRGAQGDSGRKPEAKSVYIFRMVRHTSPERLSNGLASRCG